MARALVVVLATLLLLAGCGADPVPETDALPQSPFGTVLAVAAPDADTVLAVTDAKESCDACASLWRWEAASGRWSRVHDFGDPAHPATDEGHDYPPVDGGSLTFADGRRGWFRWSGGELLGTEDGGRSWTELAAPGKAEPEKVLVTSRHLFVAGHLRCGADDCPAEVWRRPLSGGGWTRATLPEDSRLDELRVRGDVLGVSGTRAGVPEHRSGDGLTWSSVRVSGDLLAQCPGCPQPCPAELGFATVHVVRCATGAGAEVDRVHVSSDGHTWRELRLPPPRQGGRRVSWVMSADEKGFVVGSDAGVVHTGADGSMERVRGLVADWFPEAWVFPTGRVGVALGSGLWRTEDGGLSWRRIG